MRAKVTTYLAFFAAPKLWLLVFFILPMMAMLLYSFWRVIDYQIVADFTLRNYQKIGGPLYVGVFLSTIKLSIYVTVLSLLIGYPVAYFLYSQGPPIQDDAAVAGDPAAVDQLSGAHLCVDADPGHAGRDQ